MGHFDHIEVDPKVLHRRMEEAKRAADQQARQEAMGKAEWERFVGVDVPQVLRDFARKAGQIQVPLTRQFDIGKRKPLIVQMWTVGHVQSDGYRCPAHDIYVNADGRLCTPDHVDFATGRYHDQILNHLIGYEPYPKAGFNRQAAIESLVDGLSRRLK